MELLEMELAFNAAMVTEREAHERAFRAVRDAMTIPAHILKSMAERDNKQLGNITPFQASPQPRYGTNGKPGVPRHGGQGG